MAPNPNEAERKGKQSSRVRLIPRIALIPVGVVVAGAVILLLISSVGHTAEWTGLKDFTDPTGQYHRGKTLWDWAELLIIPLGLGIVLWWLNRLERQNELKIAADRLQEEALQAYFDRMTELLLEKGLRQSAIESEVQAVAQTRTLSTLRRLDGTRKGMLIQFLYDSRLIGSMSDENVYTKPVFSLVDADLRRAILSDANLNGAFLAFADLRDADLSEAWLIDAKLSHAKLNGALLAEAWLWNADLSGAKLNRANLVKANLEGAILSETDLTLAELEGASLSGGELRDADLIHANLRRASMNAVFLLGANLTGADLSGADLTEAKITLEQLAQAKSLKGAIMPDGTKHD